VLAALLLHARDYRWGRLPAGFTRGIAVLCYALGALSKESAFILPAFLVLYDLVLGRGPSKRIKDYAMYAAAALVLLGVRAAATAGPKTPIAFADNPVIRAALGVRLVTAIAVIGRYVGLLLWPARLSVDYSFAQTVPLTDVMNPAFLAGLVAIAALAGIGFALRSRPLAFAGIFFLVAIAPTSNVFFPIGTIMAERLLYLPSVSIALVAGFAADALRRSSPVGRRALFPALALLAVVALTWRTVERNRDWRSNATLFESAARVSPKSFRVRSVLAEIAEERGDLAAARTEFERAIAIWPKWSYTFWRLGTVVRKQGDIAGSQPYFRKALEIDDKMRGAYFSLGESEQQLHRYDSAVQCYEKLETLEPCHPGLHQNLGYALRDAGRPADAEAAFRRGIACTPDSAGLYRGLAVVLEDRADRAGAERAYREALTRDPDDAVSANNLAWLLAEKGPPPDEALALAERALRINPSATVYDTMAWIRYRRGDVAGAREAAAEAVRRDSTSAEILDRWRIIEAAWRAGNRQGGTP
jgi:tetratricopeptide (TPR) repeat protein